MAETPKRRASRVAYESGEAARERKRGYRLRAVYGLTVEQYDDMLAAQGGVCAICSRPPGKTRLHVDHDHKTGIVRGLLCFSCNHRVLSAARDNPAVLRAAAEYIEAPPAVAVIGTVVAPPRKKKKRKPRTTTKKEV